MQREDLVKLDEEMKAAWVARDVDLILSHCADDVLFLDFGFEPAREGSYPDVPAWMEQLGLTG